MAREVTTVGSAAAAVGHSAPTARNVMITLRERILAVNEERVFLGSEADLCADLGVSRPTLRQAVRILEQEQLLDVRRGVNGGFYTRRPTPEAVAEIASVYLRSVRVEPGDLIRAQWVIGGEIAVLAAERGSEEGKRRLQEFVADYQSRSRVGEHKWFHETTIEFARLTATLSGSITLELFSNVLATLGTMPIGVRAFADVERRDSVREYHRQVSAAIAAGDTPSVREIERQRQLDMSGWFEDE